ncbi:hypothetical protein GCM10010468_33060 [Actinocorallia longicatena]|uniref:Secreted protein n=2 Tax=Actinocorallia longicatena TaxID=111803 RepID=A0ABP6QFB6_9ACTN
MSPQSITAGTKTVRFTVTITNSSATAIPKVRLHLSYGGQITTRSELDAFARSNADPAGVTDAEAPVIGPFDLEPGDTVRNLVWSRPGAIAGNAPTLNTYPLVIKALDVNGQPLDTQHTFVTYVPKNAKKLVKTKVSFVWPLIDRPHRTTDSIFFDDQLSDAVTDGRLNTLLTAAESNPNTGTTLAIDPGLLDDLQTMSSANYFLDPPKDTEKGKSVPKNPQTQAWLTKLRALVKERRTAFFLTPYGDPDSVALVGQNMAGTGSKKNGSTLGLLSAAYRDKSRGQAVLQVPETYPRVAWPASGTIDQATIDKLTTNYKKGLGSDLFLLSSSFWPAGQNGTPTATTSIQSTDRKSHPALAFDDTIQNVISGATKKPEDIFAAEQRYLAETAVMTAEQPGRQRTLVVSPDRRWNPGLEFAQFLLKNTALRSAWLKPVSLGQAATSTKVERLPQQRPQSAELTADHLRSVRAMDADAVAFSKIFIPQPDESLRHAGMRASSTYWRGTARRRSQASTFLSVTRTDVGKEINKVRVLVDADTKKSVTGSSATVLLTLVNDLKQPVKVHVQISSTKSNVLLVNGKKNMFIYDDELEAGAKVPLQVPMEQTNTTPEKETEVKIQIITSGIEPARLVREQFFKVGTNDIPPAGWLITIGALVIMGLGVGFRGMRARKRRSAEAETEEAEHDRAAAG